jgi:competence protein ComEA
MAFPTSVNDQITDVVELSEGLGPVMAKAIIDERDNNGPFKNAADLAARVGLSPKLVSELEAQGLIIRPPPA